MPELSSYQHGQFSWIDLMSHDAAKARTFYEKVFDWKSEEQGHRRLRLLFHLQTERQKHRRFGRMHGRDESSGSAVGLE